MAIAYPLFYNSIEGDRIYNADSFSDWLKKFFTTGVFTGDFDVQSIQGMYIEMGGGYVNIGGKVMIFDDTTLTIPVADSQYKRIDNIVIERNDTDRQFYLKVVQGSPAASPVAPTPVRTGGVYQLVLARVLVNAGATDVSPANITDTRADTDLCGIVTGTVEEMDFSVFTAQFEDYFNTFKANNLDSFETWFQTIRGILDEDVAGNLQNEIDNDVVNRDEPMIDLDLTDETDANLMEVAYNDLDWKQPFYNNSVYVKRLFERIAQQIYDHEETKTVCVTLTGLTVPGKTSSASGTLALDFSSYFDNTKYAIWSASCCLGTKQLPYITGSSFTTVSDISGSTVTITNGAAAWVNYTGYFTLVLKRRA